MWGRNAEERMSNAFLVAVTACALFVLGIIALVVF